MKTQPREVYGYGAKLRTARRISFAAWALLIIPAAILLGVAWS